MLLGKKSDKVGFRIIFFVLNNVLVSLSLHRNNGKNTERFRLGYFGDFFNNNTKYT